MRSLVRGGWALCGLTLVVGTAAAQPPGVQISPPTTGMAKTAEGTRDTTLRVCADPHGMPQSNDRGEGY